MKSLFAAKHQAVVATKEGMTLYKKFKKN